MAMLTWALIALVVVVLLLATAKVAGAARLSRSRAVTRVEVTSPRRLDPEVLATQLMQERAKREKTEARADELEDAAHRDRAERVAEDLVREGTIRPDQRANFEALLVGMARHEAGNGRPLRIKLSDGRVIEQSAMQMTLDLLRACAGPATGGPQTTSVVTDLIDPSRLHIDEDAGGDEDEVEEHEGTDVRGAD